MTSGALGDPGWVTSALVRSSWQVMCGVVSSNQEGCPRVKCPILLKLCGIREPKLKGSRARSLHESVSQHCECTGTLRDLSGKALRLISGRVPGLLSDPCDKAPGLFLDPSTRAPSLLSDSSRGAFFLFLGLVFLTLHGLCQDFP